MREFVSLGAGTLLSPVPAVMVSCARAGEKPNIITLAWAGTVCSQPPMVALGIRKERYSHDIIRESGEFVVNIPDTALARATDLCGVKSGSDTDKFAAAQLTPVAAEGMRLAPAIAQCPLHLCCRLESVTALGSHDLFLGRVTAVGVDKELLDENGKLNLQRVELLAYAHGVYRAVREALGFFGYSVAAPDVLERRMRDLR